MDVNFKHFIKINKIYLIVNFCAAVVLTLYGGGSFFAFIIYNILTALCGMKFLKAQGINCDENNNYRDIAKAKRGLIFDTYVKMMILQSAVMTCVFALGTLLGNSAGSYKFLPEVLFKNETIYSRSGYYLVFLCLTVSVIMAMARLINSGTIIKKAVIIISIIYCAPLWFVLYLLLLTLAHLTASEKTVYKFFAAAAVAAFCFMIVLLCIKIRKNKKLFLTDKKAKDR